MVEDVTPAAGNVKDAPPSDALRRFALGAIYVLSAMVILALAGVAYAVFLRPAHRAAPEAATGGADVAAVLHLPAGAVVQSLQVSGDRMVIELRGQAGTEIDIIDLHDGHRVARITSARPAAPAAP